MRGVANGTFLIIMGAISTLFVVGMESGHIALARHHDNTNVLDSDINVQTDTNQGQACETAGSASPISDSCTASSTNTITQGAVPVPPSKCSDVMFSHPTILTLSVFPNNGLVPTEGLAVMGTLTDTCTGSGVPGVTITFTYSDTPSFPLAPAVTSATGTYVRGLGAPFNPGTYTVQAHFAGHGIFEPSNSGTQTYTVVAP
jgi:hypothetical protein